MTVYAHKHALTGLERSRSDWTPLAYSILASLLVVLNMLVSTSTPRKVLPSYNPQGLLLPYNVSRSLFKIIFSILNEKVLLFWPF